MNSCLIVMARPPILGKSKTRLAATIGNQKAYEMYNLMLERTLEIANSTGFDTRIFFTEKNSYTENFTLFPFDYQTEGDLGEKMKLAFQKTFDLGYDKVIVIGTDCPDNDSENILLAFKKLENNDVVIGPSGDGGYYMLGLKSMILGLFEGIEWSSAKVFSQSKMKLQDLEKTLFELKTINDIDLEEDLIRSPYFSNRLNKN